MKLNVPGLVLTAAALVSLQVAAQTTVISARKTGCGGAFAM
ncbi:MAG TPA: hypothetical protein VN655_06230 [Pseudolabrys sp.]|nr:hypothetical protein [Pseudolabrys sp.]